MSNIKVENWGLVSYETSLKFMQEYTKERDDSSKDLILLLEHEPVYTLGQNAANEHILSESQIPIIKTDRGGQVTYHGPGQIIIYPLLDLKRLKLNLRELIEILENSVIELLKNNSIEAYSDRTAPGVYVKKQKIASLGLRIKKNRCYHGLAFNADMDLTPFNKINPCGYTNLKMCQMQDFVPNLELINIQHELVRIILKNINSN